MNAVDRGCVTLGADVGGKDASIATSEHVMALRKSLEQACRGPYSAVIKEFALILRIDGSVQSWGKSGVENGRLQKKAGYATVDIFMPQDVWKSGDRPTILRFLATGVRDAVADIVQRASRAKVPLQADQLIRDVEHATHSRIQRGTCCRRLSILQPDL